MIYIFVAMFYDYPILSGQSKSDYTNVCMCSPYKANAPPKGHTAGVDPLHNSHPSPTWEGGAYQSSPLERFDAEIKTLSGAII